MLHRKLQYFTVKRIIFFVAILIILIIVPMSLARLLYAPIVRADSLFKLDEGYGSAVNDDNGNVASGTITNAVWKTEDLCVRGKCLYFDGSGDYVSFADDDTDLDFVAADDFTITGWFRHPPIATNPDYLITKHQAATAGGYKIYMDSDGDIVFAIDDDGTWDTANLVGDDQSKNFDDNRWHHFAVQKDGTTGIYLYVDGNLIDQDTDLTNDTGSLANAASFYIGVDADGTSNSWSGFLDEIKVYRSFRTAAEIKADFTRETPSRGTSASFGPDQSYLSNGLVGYWKMEETSTPSLDFSGNGNSGTWGNNITSVNGKFGKSQEFDGTGDYIDAGTGSSLHNLSPLTYSGWIKPDTVGENSRGRLFQSAADNSGHRLLFLCSACSGQLYFTVDYDGADDLSVESATGVIPYGSWSHVAVTWDGSRTASNVKMYVNGVEVSHLVNTDATGNLVADTGQNFYIGNRPGTTNRSFDGVMDDVRIYNRALSPADIQKLYSWAPGPVGWWKMDEGSWTNNCSTLSVRDSSGNGNNMDSCPNGTGPVGNIPGKYGKAGYFDGSDDSIGALDSDSLDITTSWTLETWFKPNNLTQSGSYVLSKLNNTGTDNVYALLWEYTNNTVELYCGAGCTMGYGSGAAASSRITVSDTNWHHIVFAYNGSVLTGFLDGVAAFSPVTGSLTLTASTNSLIIGAYRRTAPTYNSNATLDDIKIYSYARTPGQVVEDMNAGHPAPGSPVGSAVGYWKFDEGALNTCSGGSNDFCDNSINANDLAYSGSTGGITADGRYDKAYQGADNTRITRADDEDFDFTSGTDDFTLSAWFRRATVSNTEYILDKHATNDGYTLYMDSDGDIVCGIGDGTSWPEDTAGTTAANYDNNTWHQAVCVKSGTASLTLYIDGKQVAQDASLGANADMSNSGKLIIGDTDEADGTDEWLGSIDEVKMYRSALTVDQVIAGYNQGSQAVLGKSMEDTNSSLSEGLVGYWKMDDAGIDAEGETITDSSGNGTSGTLYGDNGVADNGTGMDCVTGSKFATGCNFDGTDDYVNLGQPTILRYVDSDYSWTVSAWYNSTDAVSIRKNLIYNTGSWNITCGNEYGNKTCKFSKLSGGYPYVITNNGAFSPNVWQHIVITGSGSASTIKIYINGVDQTNSATENFVWDGYFTGGDFVISNKPENSNVWQGQIDDLRIYNRALSPVEVQQLHEWAPGPVAEWKMDENTGTTLQDSSGNGNTSTTWTGDMKYIPGYSGSGLLFDNNDDVVRIAETTSTDVGGTSSSYTVSAWVKTTSAASETDGIVEKLGAATGATPFRLYLRGTSKIFGFACVDSLDATCGAEGTLVVNDGKWHYVAAVRDVATDKTYTYVDGVMDTSTTDNTTTTMVNDYDISIGNGRLDYAGDDFDGSIDQVRIYNYARTPAQIAWEFNHGKPALGWWKLDDNVTGNGQTIYDASTWGNNGTTADSGATLACTVQGKRNLACDLDGANDWIDMNDVTLFNTAVGDGRDFSVAGWFNRDLYTTDDIIAGKRANQVNTSPGWFVWVDADTDKLTFEACDSTSNCDLYKLESASTFLSTGWNHFVVTWDDDTEANTTIYINGVAEAVTRTGTFANINSLAASSRDFRIGAQHDGSNPFDGKLDDIMFFSYALNARQVKLIMNEGAATRFGPASGAP